MTTTHRLSVGAVLKMATEVAQRHVDAPGGDRGAEAGLIEAISATWQLVKSRLGSQESEALDAMIAKVVGHSVGAKASVQAQD